MSGVEELNDLLKKARVRPPQSSDNETPQGRNGPLMAHLKPLDY